VRDICLISFLFLTKTFISSITIPLINKKRLLMALREQDKHFLSSLYWAISIIFVWKGLWEGLYELPYIGDPFVFLFIGFAMLTFSGLIFKEFDPLGGVDKAITQKLQEVKSHPQKQHFEVVYVDKFQKKDVKIPATDIEKVEEGALVLKTENKEIFIPTHRIKEILFKGKREWRL